MRKQLSVPVSLMVIIRGRFELLHSSRKRMEHEWRGCFVLRLPKFAIPVTRAVDSGLYHECLGAGLYDECAGRPALR
jgi:hypothetical protein